MISLNPLDLQARLVGAAVSLLVLAGLVWGIYYAGGKSATTRIENKINKSNAVTKVELDKAGKKLDQKYAPRASFREGTKDYFAKALEEHGNKSDEEKSDDSVIATGISDDGVRLINEAIDCRERESEPKRSGQLPQAGEAERERGRKGCKVGG